MHDCMICILSFFQLKFLLPEYASQSSCQWLYVVTFGGGLVEGDEIDICLEVKENTSIALVTQSSTKV